MFYRVPSLNAARLIFMLLVSILPFSSHSVQLLENLEQQRDLFQQAEQALKDNQRSRYWEILNQIHEYPLYPYLRYQDLVNRLDSASDREVLTFIQAYEDTPVAGNLRTRWLFELAKQKKWSLFLQQYQHTGSQSLVCLRELARIATIKNYDSPGQRKAIWLSGQSLPDKCDDLIDYWKQNGLLTENLYKQRLRLALKKRNVQLATFLHKQLSPAAQRRYSTWIDVYKDSRLLLTSQVQKHPDAETLIKEKFSALAWYYPDQAIEFIENLPSRKYRQIKQLLTQTLAISLARRFHPDADKWLKKVKSSHTTERVKKWKLRMALADNDWDAVLKHYYSLDTATRNNSRWRYWQARALEEQNNKTEASAIYARLATERSYEGFMAADRLGIDYAFNNKRLDIDEEFVAILQKNRAMIRARELMVLKRFHQARSEWNRATSGFNEIQLATAAWLAYQWGWSHQTIVTLAGIAEWDDLHLRFPVKHLDTIKKHTHQTVIDPALALAVIRQESAFQENALSRTRARGLMQLMPSTARQVAREMKFNLSNLSLLNHPEINIQLGIYYLNEMKEQLMQHPVLAIAAYNAGKSRVESWLESNQDVALDIWIENIPFKETRHYVRNILAYAVIYEMRLGLPVGKISDRMPSLPVHDDLDEMDT